MAWDLYDLATSPEQPEPRSGEGRREARAAGATDAAQRAVTFLQQCNINVIAPAHNLCEHACDNMSH